MNRRALLRHVAGATAFAVGTTALGRHGSSAQGAAPAADLDALGLPEVTISVDDTGFRAPEGVTAGRMLITVANTGSKELHFFAVRVPDEVSEAQLAAEMATPTAEDPAWFDMTTLPLLGTPDWPRPGGRARGVVDVTPGRWLLVDPLDGREVAVWTVGGAASDAAGPEPAADVEVGLREMEFTGLDQVVPAGPRIWKITNQGALDHELALLSVPPETTSEGLSQTIGDLLQGKGDPSQFAPIAGQGAASKGVTSWQLFDLKPGTYAAVCMAPAPGEDFMPHAMMGMIRIFTAR